MEKEICLACNGTGEWETECCSGVGGCSCNGDPVYMGKCNVCEGTGYINENSDPAANLKAINGACFIGSGPNNGIWAGMGKRLNVV